MHEKLAAKIDEFKGSRLSVWLGELRGTMRDWVNAIPFASLLGTIAAGTEDTPLQALVRMDVT
jgi:hypothetical protein